MEQLTKNQAVSIFFYKQKTEYEIDCDWSSDVCSSDLPARLSANGPATRCAALRYWPAMASRTCGILVRRRRTTGSTLPGCSRSAVTPAWWVCAEPFRSEERRVGKECRSRWSPYH